MNTKDYKVLQKQATLSTEDKVFAGGSALAGAYLGKYINDKILLNKSVTSKIVSSILGGVAGGGAYLGLRSRIDDTPGTDLDQPEAVGSKAPPTEKESEAQKAPPTFQERVDNFINNASQSDIKNLTLANRAVDLGDWLLSHSDAYYFGELPLTTYLATKILPNARNARYKSSLELAQKLGAMTDIKNPVGYISHTPAGTSKKVITLVDAKGNKADLEGPHAQSPEARKLKASSPDIQPFPASPTSHTLKKTVQSLSTKGLIFSLIPLVTSQGMSYVGDSLSNWGNKKRGKLLNSSNPLQSE